MAAATPPHLKRKEKRETESQLHDSRDASEVLASKATRFVHQSRDSPIVSHDHDVLDSELKGEMKKRIERREEDVSDATKSLVPPPLTRKHTSSTA